MAKLYAVVIPRSKEPFFREVEPDRLVPCLAEIVGGATQVLPVVSDTRYVMVVSGITTGKRKNLAASRLTGQAVYGTASLLMQERGGLRPLSQFAAKVAVRNLFGGGVQDV